MNRNTVTPRRVSARVRHAGTSVPFAPRTFDLMLGAHDTPKQNQAESKRILRQLGYDVAAGPVEVLA